MSIKDIIGALRPEHIEGQVFVKVKMTPELMEQWASRDIEGHRLIWDWGEPDREGFYTPSVTIDFEDKL